MIHLLNTFFFFPFLFFIFFDLLYTNGRRNQGKYKKDRFIPQKSDKVIERPSERVETFRFWGASTATRLEHNSKKTTCGKRKQGIWLHHENLEAEVAVRSQKQVANLLSDLFVNQLLVQKGSTSGFRKLIISWTSRHDSCNQTGQNRCYPLPMVYASYHLYRKFKVQEYQVLFKFCLTNCKVDFSLYIL